jgi:hypothetical protein
MAVSVNQANAPEVTISLAELSELYKASERIAAVERYITANDYVSEKDIIAILGIKGKENKE